MHLASPTIDNLWEKILDDILLYYIAGRSAKLLKKSLDSMEGSGFGGLKKKSIPEGSPENFQDYSSRYERSLDLLEGEGFGNMEKKRNLFKKSLDVLDGSGFGGLRKRSSRFADKSVLS